MEIKKGIPVSPGVVIKEALVLDSEDYRIPTRYVPQKAVPSEVKRFKDSLVKVGHEVAGVEKKAEERFGDELVGIFRAQVEMLQDASFINKVERMIRDHRFSAEYAVSRVLRRYANFLRDLDDPYLSQRFHDIHALEKRLLAQLLGEKREEVGSLSRRVVIIAHDLTPAQTAVLDKNKILGFATDVGGRTSHTAILARALGIPAVVALGKITSEVSGGDTVIIDGNRGVVIISPDEATIAKYRAVEEEFHTFERELAGLRDMPAETTDACRIRLYGNIESPDEINVALENGADGIGLYRTEFLYAGSGSIPTEKDHLEAYMRAATMLGEKPIVIRTLDLGGDKFFGEQDKSQERNPVLGCRSIRYCLQNPDLFRTQLRAILRTTMFGDVRILFPMISSLEELREARRMLQMAMNELDKQQVPHKKDIPVGIMIEVPSAALIADLLAPEVDFFSIGTNDLIQYVLAVDRGNETVADLYSPVHPAVLRLVRHVIEAAELNNIPVAMCGEMSGEVVYTILLLGMGLREFSVSPAAVPEIKKVIRSVSLDEARKMAEAVRTAASSEEALSLLKRRVGDILPEAFHDL